MSSKEASYVGNMSSLNTSVWFCTVFFASNFKWEPTVPLPSLSKMALDDGNCTLMVIAAATSLNLTTLITL